MAPPNSGPAPAGDAASSGSASLLGAEFAGNSVREWGIALITAIVVFLAIHIGLRIVASRVARLAKRTSTGVDDLISDIASSLKIFFSLAVALYVGAQMLALSAGAKRALLIVLVVAVSVQAAILGGIALKWGIAAYVKRRTARDGREDPALITTMGAVRLLGLIVLYSAILVIALDNLGVNVTALITTLGVGGIAVALAVQSILADLFASLSIVLDKPFVIGDFIIVGDRMGTVERIGLKTTRVRALSGEQLVFSNSDLLSSRLQNFKRMQERRIAFSVGVEYGTPLEAVKEIPGLLRGAVEAQKDVRFDRAHFKSFGASSLDFEVVYFVLSPEFNVYMDKQQAINLRIAEEFQSREIEFAFPTRTVHVHMAGEQEEAAAAGSAEPRPIPSRRE